MALTHVCLWKEGEGYCRISAEEAARLYPDSGVSARSGTFVCELCAQNVLLTAPAKKVIRHFRHDPASPNKECDDRQAAFDDNYGRRMYSMSSHTMPLRIVVDGRAMQFQIGFFSLPDDSPASCRRIHIESEGNFPRSYSFSEVAGARGLQYLDAGSIPVEKYTLTYDEPNAELRNYWPAEVPGISRSGTFFRKATGKRILAGGKAFAGETYYLLDKRRLADRIPDIESRELLSCSDGKSGTWFLYEVRILRFSKEAASFFLKRAVFLTERPFRFFSIWPLCKRMPGFIFYGEKTSYLYFYIQGSDAAIRVYPQKEGSVFGKNLQKGKVVRVPASDKEQLALFGISGALGFAYLRKIPYRIHRQKPAVWLRTPDGKDFLPGDRGAGSAEQNEFYLQPPVQDALQIFSRYDGQVIYHRDDRIIGRQFLKACEWVQTKIALRGCILEIYQGCDCVRKLIFGRAVRSFAMRSLSAKQEDEEILCRLKKSRGEWMIIPAGWRAAAAVPSDLPLTRKWLLAAIQAGKIRRDAYWFLVWKLHHETKGK